MEYMRGKWIAGFDLQGGFCFLLFAFLKGMDR